MKDILFIRFSSLGDTVLTTGVIRKVNELLPDARLCVLTYEEFKPVWQNLRFVTKIYTIKRKIGFLNFLSFLFKMPKFDMIFDLHSSVRSLIARHMMRGKVSVYDKQPIIRRLFVRFKICKNWLKLHTVQRYAEAVFPALGFKMPLLEELRPFIPVQNPTDAEKAILHPFASKATKVWPYFAELAQRLAAVGWKVYVIGNGFFPDINGVKRVKTPEISKMIEFISDAAFVVTTDSGPMHTAVALNRRIVAIFGGTTKELGFSPYFSGCEIIERDDLLCRPCHIHGLPSCPKLHFDCMKLIDAETVMKTVATI